MKKFSFRFAAVQTQRGALLDQAGAVLADVTARQDYAERLLDLKRTELTSRSNAGPKPGSVFDPSLELLRHRHLEAIRGEITRREVQLKTLNKTWESAREAVAEAHREVRAIELLEQRDRAAWLKEALHEEQKEADEQNTQRFKRADHVD